MIRRIVIRFSLTGFYCLGLIACSAQIEATRLASLRENLPTQTTVNGVPFYPQQQYHCGPAALAMLLTWSGIQRQPEQLTEYVFLPAKSGSMQADMLATARRHGRIAYPVTTGLEGLGQELAAGHPVLVLQNLGLDWLPRWHYAVATGLDLNRQTLRLHTGISRDYELNLATFLHTWHRADSWAVVILAPDHLPASADSLAYLQAIQDTVNSLTESPGAGLDTPILMNKLEAAYRQATKRWPKQPLVKMGLANWYIKLHQPDKAEQTLTNLLSQFPDYAPAHNNLALVLLQQKRFTEALQHATTALKLGGRYQPAYQDTVNQVRLGLQ